MTFTNIHRYAATMLALLLATPALAQDAPQKKKDDHPNITCIAGWNGYYRPQRWMPLQFQVVIENPTKEGYDGMLRVVSQQDSLVKMTVHKPALVTKNLPLEVTLAVKTVYNPSEIRAEFLEGSVRRWGEDILQTRNLKPLKNQDKLLVVVKDTGPSSLGQLAQRYNHAHTGQVVVSTQMIEKLPDDWAVYDAVDLVVLQDPQWQRMTQPARQALIQWVHRGGKLLLVPGSSNPLTSDHALSTLLPFSIGPLATREVGPVQLESLNVPTHWTNTWPLTYWDLSQAPTLWRQDATTAFVNDNRQSTGVPWMVAGPVGLGQVGVLAFNPDRFELFKDNLAAALPLWAQAFEAMGLRLTAGAPAERSGSYYEDYEDSTPGDMNATNSVISHLLAIPQLRPLSIWWVIGLLSALALLLGPLDYFVLRKFDRLPWTWITSTVVIVLFSVGAWYGVQRIRGGTLQVRVVSVIDGMEAPGTPGVPRHVSATYYGGIFAPDSDNYKLDLVARPERIGAETTWWSAISPESGRRGYGYGYDDSIAGRQMACVQDDTGNRITDLPISIWSMQCLINETQDVSMPFRATVTAVGGIDANGKVNPGHVRLVVMNLADTAIASGEMRLGGSSGWLGVIIDRRIPPGGTEVFEDPLIPAAAWADKTYGHSNVFNPNDAFLAAGTRERTEAMRRLISQGAAVVTVRYDDAPLPFQVAKRNNDAAHIQMARLVVWPTAGQ